MTGHNLGNPKDATAALTLLAQDAARLRGEVTRAGAELAKWRTITSGVRAMADQAVKDQDRLEEVVRVASQRLLPAERAAKADVPVDFTTADAALRSLGEAVVVRNSLSKSFTDLEAELHHTLENLRNVGELILAAGTLTKEEVQQITSRTASKAGLDANDLDAARPLAAHKIADLAAHFLRHEGKPLTTQRLLALMANAGRPVEGNNPAGALRSSILARGEDFAVESAGRGLWRLKDWPDGTATTSTVVAPRKTKR